MSICQTSWEDDENNREVVFRVEYAMAEDHIDVIAITPQHINFRCSETGSTVRTIRVWREKSRALLVRDYLASGKIDEWKTSVLNQPLAQAS